MALIFPNTPIGSLAPETARVFRLLKRLADEDYAVWQHLMATDQAGPDFLVRHRSGAALLIAVSPATPADVRLGSQHSLFEAAPTVPGAAQRDAMGAFLTALATPENAVDTACIPTAVLFPAVPTALLRSVLPSDTVWAGKDDLTPEHFPQWVQTHLGAALPLATAERLRAAFSPEVVVPASLTVRTPRERSTDARMTDYLLSYSQERALKADLDLSDEAQSASEALGTYLVSGVAGSGKSLLVLYRARLLRQFFPTKRVLVLTHNRPLIHDLEARYGRLAGHDHMVEWRTFYSWVVAHQAPEDDMGKAISARTRLSLVEEVWARTLADTSITAGMLDDEISWFKDRLLNSRDEYLAADRAGRGFGLNAAMRERVFVAIQAYRREMTVRGWIDWGDIPRRFWRALQEGRAEVEPYDFVLIDEAQFFAPIWFEIIKQVVAPRGHLFLVADPTQGFLRRGQSWLASGIQVRGRSMRLETSYRTTRPILQFASRMYQMRVPNDAEALVPGRLDRMPDGPAPQLVALDSEQDERTQVVNEIRALLDGGVPRDHILVLHAHWQGVDAMLERLRSAFGEAAVADPRRVSPGAHMRVCTLNAATGLESPIVFVMGTHHMIEAEQSLRLTPEERTEVVRDNTRKLYMAFTRAGQRLAITYVGEPPAMLLPQVGLPTPAAARLSR